MQLHYGKIAWHIAPVLVILILSYFRRRHP
jgi:hypothetical protein